MLVEQRENERYNIFVVGEFSGAGQDNEPFLGITKDFSTGGISFESKDFGLGPGDDLNIRFKHPEDKKRVMASHGRIVWKKDAHKFHCLTGLQFSGTDSDGSGILDQLLPCVENTSHDLFSDETDTDNEVIDHNDPEPDMDDSAVPDIIEEGEPAVHGQQEAGAPSFSGRRFLFIIAVLAVGLTVLAFAIPFRHGRSGDDTDVSHKMNAPAVTQDNTGVSGTDNIAEPASNGPESDFSHPAALQEGQGSDMMAPGLPDNQQVMTGAYYVQVGAWLHDDYAADALMRVKSQYPDAYMITAGRFHKVRIPGINDTESGARVINDMKVRFAYEALLVKRE